MTSRNFYNEPTTNMKNNYMNWRSAKIAAIAVSVFVGLKLTINAIIRYTTPTEKDTDPLTGEVSEVSSGDSVFEPLSDLVSFGDKLFHAATATVVAYVVYKLFYRNTIGKTSGEDVDEGYLKMSSVEKTRWLLGAMIALTCALVIGSAKGAETLPVSVKGYNLILKYEVSSKAYYEKRLQRPTVPAWRTTSSGVTIGFGYDCGYNSRAQIVRDWGKVLSKDALIALQSVSGLKGRQAYYANQRIRHRVRVTWDQAEYVFKNKTLPRFSNLTARAFKIDSDRLHPDCNGALVATVFNRGSDMGGTNKNSSRYKRRREMRWIRYNISVNREDRVPSNFLSMKRIWSYSKLRGLHRRYDETSRVFAGGLR